jgi:hypothetical protein
MPDKNAIPINLNICDAGKYCPPRPVLNREVGHFSVYATLPAKRFDPRALTRESSANRFWPVIFVLTIMLDYFRFAWHSASAFRGTRSE